MFPFDFGTSIAGTSGDKGENTNERRNYKSKKAKYEDIFDL